MLHSSNRLAPNQHRRTSIGQCPWRSGWQCQDERLDCDSAHPEPFRDATRRSGLEDMVLSAAPAAQDPVADGEAALGVIEDSSAKKANIEQETAAAAAAAEAPAAAPAAEAPAAAPAAEAPAEDEQPDNQCMAMFGDLDLYA